MYTDDISFSRHHSSTLTVFILKQKSGENRKPALGLPVHRVKQDQTLIENAKHLENFGLVITSSVEC